MGQRGPATCCLRQAPGDFQTVESLAQFQSHTQMRLVEHPLWAGHNSLYLREVLFNPHGGGWGQSLPAKCQ